MEECGRERFLIRCLTLPVVVTQNGLLQRVRLADINTHRATGATLFHPNQLLVSFLRKDFCV